MTYDPRKHHRRSVRMRGYDYSRPGAYFITVCTHERESLFGEITNGVMHLNRMGLIVQRSWSDLPRHYPYVVLDAMVIMPNHLHGVMVLTEDGKSTKPRHGLPEIVRAFKSYSARRVNALRRTPGLAVWQRSYYEHIVRDQEDWERIRGYIHINPQEWDRDLENPLVGRGGS